MNDETDRSGTRLAGGATRIVLLGAVVIAGIVVAILSATGGKDHVGGAPTPAAAEHRIVAEGARAGMPVAASCPGDTQDTPEGANFSCTATDGHGNNVTVVAHVGPDGFQLLGDPFAQLLQAERQAQLGQN